MKQYKPRKRQPITEKQKKLLKAKLKYPHATLKELAQLSNYNDAAAVNKALDSKALKQKLQQAIQERPELAVQEVAKRLAEGVEATETKVFNDNGKLIYSEPMVAWQARHAFLELWGKFTDTIKPQEVQAMQAVFINLTDDQLAKISLKQATPADFEKPTMPDHGT